MRARIISGLMLLLLAVVLSAAIHVLLYGRLEPGLLIYPLLLFTGVILTNRVLRASPDSDGIAWATRLAGVLVLFVMLLAAFFYIRLQSTWSAWLLVAGGYLFSLIASRVWLAGVSGPRRVLSPLFAAAFVGVILVGAAEVEGRFSNEEFYSGAEAAVLGLQWLLVFASQKRLVGATMPDQDASSSSPEGGRSVSGRRGLLSAAIVFAFLLVCFFLARQYQRSFFPAEAPQYPGVSAEEPFLCGEAPDSSITYASEENERLLVKLLEANPQKGPLESGLLALRLDDRGSAQQFKTALLQEAAAGAYTAPAGSVKFGQYQAASRLYLYLRLRRAFPDLFAAGDVAALEAWFAAINRRALRVEPVDWMYALAFSKAPEGPYANQDAGAGLLSLLESSLMGDPALSSRNRAFLDALPRGWEAIFHNTDDSIAYQHIWNTNAYLISQYDPSFPPENQRLAFGWLLRLALPDGGPLNINPYLDYSLAPAAHLGAALLDDPQLVWLEGRTLAWLAAHDVPLSGSLGLDLSHRGEGLAPEAGSCLLYSNSGLPRQAGPLAPDKIVLRDGWEEDSHYLLLNLRFTGWHRYKATNSISLVYRQGVLAREDSVGSSSAWLPTGRRQFRDKRIPRENLNALAIPVQGFQAVNHFLAGLRSPWAQDPPYYATVEQFQTGEQGDRAAVRMAGWHGWEHTRTIQIYPGGPLVIHDRASGPPGVTASLFWHLARAEGQGWRRRLAGGSQPAEVVFVPLTDAEIQFDPPAGEGLARVALRSKTGGQLDMVAVFLTGDWVGAEVSYELAPAKLVIRQAGRAISVPLN